MNLLDRVNKIINTPNFQEALEKNGISLIDLQLEMCGVRDFNDLSKAAQSAITETEERFWTSGEILL